MLTLIFVYGTLRRNEPNHHLLEGAECLAEQARTSGKLLDTGNGYPALVFSDEGDVVYGELYLIDSELLVSLDALEEYYGDADPRNLYDRVEVTVQTDQDSLQAWTYVYSVTEALADKPVPYGDWKVYQECGAADMGRDMELLYFAYGSCMDNGRFQSQNVEHLFQDVEGRGIVSGYNLQFTRRASDGGRADIVESGGEVEGKLFRLSREAITYLWEREGVNDGIYRPTFVQVLNGTRGVLQQALTFVVVHKEEETAPPAWYRDEILRGAKPVVSEAYYKALERLFISC